MLEIVYIMKKRCGILPNIKAVIIKTNRFNISLSAIHNETRLCGAYFTCLIHYYFHLIITVPMFPFKDRFRLHPSMTMLQKMPE